MARLAAFLADPAFRAREGFPLGGDDDLLRRSDPPYHTACPNPFMAEFLAHHAGAGDGAETGPFACDTAAGKTHPLYTAHAYHSKVPHQAIMPCILHYTAPGEVVLDGFAGSGMTGVAAQLCGQPEPGFKARLEAERAAAGLPPVAWGERAAVMVDLSPAATFIGYNLNAAIAPEAFEAAADAFFARLESELGWMYETRHPDGRLGRIDYVVWSEKRVCPECQCDFAFWDAAYEPETRRFLKAFPCPRCGAPLTARKARRRRVKRLDPATGEVREQVDYAPVALEYRLAGSRTRHRKALDEGDHALLDRLAALPLADWVPTAPLPLGAMRDSRHLADHGITRYHHFYFPRALQALAAMWRLADGWEEPRARSFLLFMVEQAVWGLSVQNRYGASFYSQANRCLGGVYYVPPVASELSPWTLLTGKRARLAKLLEARSIPEGRRFCLSTASCGELPLPDASVDYIFTDPPFGDAIKYGDLNLLIEAWHRLHSRLDDEVLWDETKHKSLTDFQRMLGRAFAEYYRVLKPGRWMTVVFHNSQPAVWDAIQQALVDSGFVLAAVQTLDRAQGTFNQVKAPGSVRQDLVLSAYRPGVPVAPGALAPGTEAEVWAFVESRLAQLETGPWRSRHALFSQMVAHQLKAGKRVPLSAPEFYEGLRARFTERDGLFYG